MTSALSNPRIAVLNRAWRTSSGVTFRCRSGTIGKRTSAVCVVSSAFMSAPEYRRSYPYHRRAFLDGNLEVAAHAHRELPEHGGRHAVGHPAVTQLAKLPEPGASVFRCIGQRRQRHQSNGPNGTTARRLVEQPPRLVRLRPEFRRLAGQVHLDEELGSGACLCRHTGELLEQLDAINRLNRRECLDRPPRLVRLEMPDQVPARRKVRSLIDLSQGLLHAVFPEIVLPGCPGLANRGNGECLGN